MARTVTLANLRTRARELADQEIGSEFIDDTELNAYINASLGQWHGMVAKADPERYLAEETITATGASSYSLPATHLATMMVEYQESTDHYVPLYRITVTERFQYPETTTGHAFAYRLAAGNIILHPNPSSGSYRHTYITQADVLAADGDTVDGVNGWEAWIYYDAAIKCMLKEESDASYLIAERNRIQGEIEAAAQDRVMGSPARVFDVRTRHQHGPRRNRWYSEWWNF